MQGVFARALDWIAGTAPAEPASSRGGQRNEEGEEFLRQTGGPDERVAGQTWLGQQGMYLHFLQGLHRLDGFVGRVSPQTYWPELQVLLEIYSDWRLRPHSVRSW